MLYHQSYDSPLGAMSLLATDKGLCGLYFQGQAYFEKGFETSERREVSRPVLEETVAWLSAYFSGENPSTADLVLDLHGTPFQLRVWQALRAIPYGQVTTYGDLAKDLQCRSAQAIGGAVGRNPIALIVPCHRVLGAKGQLTGYASGLQVKEALLRREGLELDSLVKGD
ncbi:methylated-DNA--[protein]-cysteine S-methyltransferase [Streptococcus sp. DD12]|uniref:methylated-DNA--[protein]-cysteine S-methyltransferase n=1 Tax=Streptococcus sp. DD12 TaxID=1777880 RepID=UPI000797AF3B|nr:methylated-DNA--[protein]-cysteine S-methyltransferase [Streptococcus sp. DD12]KXT76285.1 Methylated-DNA--protein-cysteine methyltransferase [Streptococcus sp. DD12]